MDMLKVLRNPEAIWAKARIRGLKRRAAEEEANALLRYHFMKLEDAYRNSLIGKSNVEKKAFKAVYRNVLSSGLNGLKSRGFVKESR